VRIIAVDIGGTHARFAPAILEGDAVLLEPEMVLRTSDYASLEEAWSAYLGGASPPHGAAIAVAGPVKGDEVRLTNNRWVLRPSELAGALGVNRAVLINDFAAVAHAVPVCAADLRHVCGPERPLPIEGVISVVGPGTGLGVAALFRSAVGDRVIATEGGHIGFSPSDELEDAIARRLRARYGRVSVERVVCGRGLAEVHAALTGQEKDERALWQAALSGAALAPTLDRYLRLLGRVAGDVALAQGASAVVLAGGLGLRLADHLPGSSFEAGFLDKGRFAGLMASLPIKLITHSQPGLLGAAAAFRVG
jgi:glucokinase